VLSNSLCPVEGAVVAHKILPTEEPDAKRLLNENSLKTKGFPIPGDLARGILLHQGTGFQRSRANLAVGI